MDFGINRHRLPCSSVLLAVLAVGLCNTSFAQDPDSEPVAIFSVTPQQPSVNVTVFADASLSYDRPSNGPIASFNWNWGDGTAQSTGITAQHKYTTPGRYTITLTIFDTSNPPNSDSASVSITVSAITPPPDGTNRAPKGQLEISPVPGMTGEAVTFDASDSSDPDGDPLTYRVQFGDGQESGFSNNPVFTHVYDDSGTYTVRLTVRDDSNASADFVTTLNVLGPSVGNRSPVALIATGVRTGASPATLTFDGRLSYDLDGDPLVHTWTFLREGQPYDARTGDVVSQLFDKPGNYSVVLEVRDLDGATGTSDPEDIVITEPAEPVEPPPPAPVPTPEPPPPSWAQRPPSVCGLGILTPMLACLMGLLGGRMVIRRTYSRT